MSPVPREALELNHEIVEIIVRHRSLDAPEIVGALMSIAFAVTAQVHRGDAQEALAVLQRHLDLIRSTTLPPEGRRSN